MNSLIAPYGVLVYWRTDNSLAHIKRGKCNNKKKNSKQETTKWKSAFMFAI